ncbi:MAG: hypothetical protein EB060_04950, partial [Proteobacteria bacterium]|nr:hypothetical protein [Pseudomonadota bacterium]
TVPLGDKIAHIRDKAKLTGPEAGALQTIADIALTEDARGYLFRFNTNGQVAKRLGYRDDGSDKGTLAALSEKLRALDGFGHLEGLITVQDSGPQKLLIVDKRVFEHALEREPRRPMGFRPVGE